MKKNKKREFIMKKIDKELIAAVQKDDVKAVGALVGKGANVNIKNKYGQSLLQMALFKGARNLFETLLTLGADVNQKDDFGIPCLHHAIRLNRLKMMRRLLCEEKIDVNQTDRYGFTALHVASFAGLDLADLSLLVGAGAHLNQKNAWGDTALFSASTIKTVENLLYLGVNPFVENRWGEKACDYFKRRAFSRQKEILSFLKYLQMADRLRHCSPQLTVVEESKRRLNYLRQIQGNFFLKYKKLIWQNDRG